MRCPKCQYISFDSNNRCRNCGYEFSLSPEEPSIPAERPIDVAIGRDEPRPGRVDDLSLTALDTPLDRTVAEPDVAGDELRRTAPAAPMIPAEDLPLFHRFPEDEAPLVTPPAVPRQPLSVRRAAPVPRPRARNPRPEELSLDLAGGGPRQAARTPLAARGEGVDGTTHPIAGIVRRAGAGLVDLVILGTIQAGVVYLTLRACELEPPEWRVLPLIPLAAFMLLLCGGYFVLFTVAGGQTIGKMATGIRVVPEPADDRTPLRVSFGTAATRAIACLGSVAVLGAGFLPILFSADRRAFHDRVADTRVVVA